MTLLGTLRRYTIGSLVVVLGAFAAFSALSSAQTSDRTPDLPVDKCTVGAAVKLADGSADAWSRVNDLIASAQLDTHGVYQMHTLRADGADDVCLTCSAQPGAPRTDRHKIDATWHPSGAFLVMQGEMDSHPLTIAHANGLISELIANGLWSNLYATTPDGGSWHRLTDYSSKNADGALAPMFSPDGTRLMWSRLVEPASDAAPFARYRLMLADFVVDDTGTPGLANARDITPQGARFIEPHGFSADGRSVLFASDLGLESVWSMDIWTLNLDSGALVNLTHSPTYEEHATYSLTGDRIVYMSSAPYPGTFLQTDLMMMNLDGSDNRQITWFNRSGHPESVHGPVMPVWQSWNVDGSALAVTLQHGGLEYPRREAWVIHFAGPCGA